MKRLWDWLLRRSKESETQEVAPENSPYRTIAVRSEPDPVDPYAGDPHAELWRIIDRAKAARRYKMTEDEYEQEFSMDEPPPPKVYSR